MVSAIKILLIFDHHVASEGSTSKPSEADQQIPQAYTPSFAWYWWQIHPVACQQPPKGWAPDIIFNIDDQNQCVHSHDHGQKWHTKPPFHGRWSPHWMHLATFSRRQLWHHACRPVMGGSVSLEDTVMDKSALFSLAHRRWRLIHFAPWFTLLSYGHQMNHHEVYRRNSQLKRSWRVLPLIS